MTDVSVPYVLTTPAGTITFNDDSADQFYLTNIEGLDGAPIRAPIDDAPQTDGGIVHDFYLGPRHIIMEGTLLILSTRVQNSILTIRNQMEADLIEAHESLRSQDGDLQWTPLGQSARQLTVRGDVPVQTRHEDNYLTVAFAFGLVAADPAMME
jgi:hypothetical protein